jgi:hypothetical protein
VLQIRNAYLRGIMRQNGSVKLRAFL